MEMQDGFTRYCDKVGSNTALALTISLIYMPFLLAMQYSKHTVQISRPESALEYIAVLHSEMSLYLLLIAAVTFAVSSVWTAYVIFTLYYAVCFVDHLTWFAFGRPFHPADFMRAVEFVRFYGEFLTVDAVGWKSIAFLSAPFAAAVPPLLERGRGSVSRSGPGRGAGDGNFKSIVLAMTAVALSGYAALMPLVMHGTYLHYNTLFRIAEGIHHEKILGRLPLSAAKKDEFFGVAPPAPTNLPGRRFNVIFYVYETAPSAFYPEMSFLREWAGHRGGSLHFMPDHYTTYPESHRAFLSMMTGNYPCLIRGTQWIDSYDYGDALPKVLEQNGYQTFLLSVAPLRFNNEETMVRRLGFRSVSDSTIAKEAYAQAKRKKGKLDRTTLYQADQDLLQEGLDIIRTHRDHPYLLAFLPQASHAPFQVPPGYAGEKSQNALFDANARWQFGLISRILKCLEETGQARKTILIVVGDHGLRHPAETSLFRDQMRLSPLTFKVPLAYYCPQKLPKMQQRMTSHVDIPPTLLEMLGIPYRPASYQGRSMLSAPVSRTLFFLGGDYLPVSGFTRDGWFFMQNMNRDLVLKSPRFNFDDPAALQVQKVQNGPERDRISRDLTVIEGLLKK